MSENKDERHEHLVRLVEGYEAFLTDFLNLLGELDGSNAHHDVALKPLIASASFSPNANHLTPFVSKLQFLTPPEDVMDMIVQKAYTPCGVCGKRLTAEMTMCLLCGDVVETKCFLKHGKEKHPGLLVWLGVESYRGAAVLESSVAFRRVGEVYKNEFGSPFDLFVMRETRGVLDVQAFESLKRRLFFNEVDFAPADDLQP